MNREGSHTMEEFTSHTGIDKKELAPGVVVWDHGTKNGMNMARASINLLEGQFYPADKFVRNEEATLDLFVLDGRGTVLFKDGQEFSLSGYDRLTIPAKTPYRYTQCVGFHALMVSAHPEWTAEQYSEATLE